MSRLKYKTGDIIASNKYMGEVKGAFLRDGSWNYIIGDNADIDDGDTDKGFKVGLKYINEKNVTLLYYNGAWRGVRL